MPSKREAKTSYKTQTCPHEVNSSQSEAQMTVPTAIDHRKIIEKSMTGRVGEYNSISTGGKWQSEQHRWTERGLLSIRWKILIWTSTGSLKNHCRNPPKKGKKEW